MSQSCLHLPLQIYLLSFSTLLCALGGWPDIIGSLGFLAFCLECLANREAKQVTNRSKKSEVGVYVLPPFP